MRVGVTEPPRRGARSMIAERPCWAPDHVPVDLVWDHDIRDYARELDDPFVAAARLHDGPKLIWARAMARDRPGWAPVSSMLIEEVLRDYQTFSSADAIGLGRLLGVPWRLNPLEYDPPEHRAYRRILQPWFQPNAIANLEGAIRRIACELIAQFENDDGCEFIAQFARLFPSRVFLHLMGLPRARLERFLEWEDLFIRSPVAAERLRAGHEIINLLEEHIEDRRRRPIGDLTSALLSAEVGGRPLNADELMGMAYLLYIAGLDTVLASSGWHMKHLAGDPELQDRLQRNPSEIPAAVEELLRAFGVLGSFRRVTKDTVFHGVEMKRNDTVVIAPFLASRDPERYEDPHLIRLGRETQHVTLSSGAHNCLGAHLARRELTLVLEEFLSRFSKIRIPEGEQAAWQVDGAWSVTRLPLEWRRRA